MFEYLRMLPANRGMLVLSYHFIWQSLENERCGYKTKRGVTQNGTYKMMSQNPLWWAAELSTQCTLSYLLHLLARFSSSFLQDVWWCWTSGGIYNIYAYHCTLWSQLKIHGFAHIWQNTNEKRYLFRLLESNNKLEIFIVCESGILSSKNVT